MTVQHPFRFRAFVSLLTTFSFVMMAVTGCVLYITPPGRVVNWTNWAIWGLSKQEWGGLHICFCTLFLICSVFHIWLNRKPLLSYFISNAVQAKRLRFEWIAALGVCVIVFWGALKPFAPFSSLLALNERIKFSWDKPQQQAPVAHAELLTVEELAQKAGVEMDVILQNLKSRNIDATAEDVFGDLAEQQTVSPNELYQMAMNPPQVSAGGHGSGGFGRKTLQAACEEMDLDIEAVIERLKEAGIKASSDKTIRQIADDNGIHPSEIRQYLK